MPSFEICANRSYHMQPISVYFICSTTRVGHHSCRRSCTGLARPIMLLRECYSRAKIIRRPPGLLLWRRPGGRLLLLLLLQMAHATSHSVWVEDI